MEISSIQRHVTASSLPLDRLAASTQIPQEEKVGEVCRQFESIFVKEFLSEAQKVTLDKQSQTAGSDIYRDMVTTQMADGISRSGGFGLANALKTQLSRQLIQHANTAESGTGTAEGAKTL
jgi:Rod binding domain-containing protein